MERTKDRRGTAPVSAFAWRALTVTFPPVPLSTGVCPFGHCVISGGLDFDRVPFYSRPTGAFCHQNLQVVTFYRTPPGASLHVWCGSRRADAPTTAQLSWLCQGRRCPYSADTLNFHPVGPSGPRQEGRKVLFSESPDASAYLPGGRPPVMRVWGWGDLERPPAARRFSETHPQSLFGSFLVIQKGTRPAGRNSPPKHKKILNPS